MGERRDKFVTGPVQIPDQPSSFHQTRTDKTLTRMFSVTPETIKSIIRGETRPEEKRKYFHGLILEGGREIVSFLGQDGLIEHKLN